MYTDRFEFSADQNAFVLSLKRHKNSVLRDVKPCTPCTGKCLPTFRKTILISYFGSSYPRKASLGLFWCDFDRAFSLICGNKTPTRCNRGFYCRSYCLLNMFRAPIYPSSGAQEYYTVVDACGISCCKNSTKTYKIIFYIFTARNTTGSNHCIIRLSSWWWA